MPWESVGVIVGIVAAVVAGLTLFSLALSWLVRELIRSFRQEWEKARPARNREEEQ